MSKSDGNFFTARDAFEGRIIEGSNVPPSVLRLELIKSHYGKNMNFTKKGLADADGTVKKMFAVEKQLLDATGGDADEIGLDHPVLNKFASALADDLNMSDALAVVNSWIRSNPGKDNPKEALGVWNKLNSVLAVEDNNEATDQELETLEVAEKLCEEMNAARKAKDWEKSDTIRQKILDMGFKVNQTKDGATIDKQLCS